MEVEEVSIGRARPPVPYVPGLLGFREAPAAADALERLSAVPDAILVDGQGYAHPRRFGLACHIGLMTGLPTVGCAKSVLLGKHGPLGSERGDWTPMVDRGETVGAAVRTRQNVSPSTSPWGTGWTWSPQSRWCWGAAGDTGSRSRPEWRTTPPPVRWASRTPRPRQADAGSSLPMLNRTERLDAGPPLAAFGNLDSLGEVDDRAEV